jgi:hypothetical protein
LLLESEDAKTSAGSTERKKFRSMLKCKQSLQQ